MHIEVTFCPADTWIARLKGDQPEPFGIGDTHYEAIGRLMCVLGAIREDTTIEFPFGRTLQELG